jgi:hypothetical protein
MPYVNLGAQKYTGPSVYFHVKAVNRFQNLGSSVSRTVKDKRFSELLYATLVSWGMHDMRGAKMPDFGTFCSCIAKLSPKIEALSGYQITTLPESDKQNILDSVWQLIVELPGSATKSSRLVANSKLLHHLLPQLVPPIDRVNTGLFFGYENEASFQGKEKQIFYSILPQMISIAREEKDILGHFTYEGFNSSPTKVIDNAIVGFVEKEGLKKQVKERKKERREKRRIARA